MSYRRVALAWAVCLAALAAGCSGCAGREEPAAEEPDDSTDGLIVGVSGSDLVPRGTVIGQQDDANRYLATVSLRALSAPDGHHEYGGCSGVLLARNLALTAAHCVCAPRREATTRFDGSDCATKATVHVADFWIEAGAHPHFTMDDVAGNVLIHPRFQIVLDTQAAVVASHADLAVISLERPVLQDIRPVRLATEEAKAGEVLSVVGFGSLQQGRGAFDIMRWFSREEVQTPAGDDRFIFGPLDRADYTGDRGGPCLRETKRGLELVGVSQRGLGQTPTFTRIAPYRTWLEEQIRLAGEKP